MNADLLAFSLEKKQEKKEKGSVKPLSSLLNLSFSDISVAQKMNLYLVA